MVAVFAIHGQESATGVRESPVLNPLRLLPHPIPLRCPRAPALSALFHALNLYWRFILCCLFR